MNSAIAEQGIVGGGTGKNRERTGKAATGCREGALGDVEGRDGGSLIDPGAHVSSGNTWRKTLEYYTEKWNEFLAV
jgi:hypothetical protein